MKSSARIQAAVIWFGAVCIAMAGLGHGRLAAQGFDADDEHDAFIAGLRDRQLHPLAIDYCLETLASQQLTEARRSDITVELMRTYADQALHQTTGGRDQAFGLAHEAAQSFLELNSEFPRSVLVAVQDALIYLAEGRTTLLERQVGVVDEGARQAALQRLRTAITLLEELDAELELEIPQRFRDGHEDGQLSADQLLALRQRVRFQRGLATQYRAQLFPADDRLNRVDSLTAVIELYGELSESIPQDNALWWQVQVELAECLRRLDRHQECHTLLQNLPDRPPNEQIRTRLTVEQMWLALEADDAETALRMAVAALEGGTRQSPDFDQATLAAILALSTREGTSDTDKRRWQEQALALADEIERRHGVFWGRRADLQLVGVTADGAQLENIAILMKVADEHYLKDQLPDARNAYDKAADLAEQNQQWETWFDAGRKVGLLNYQLGDADAAADRLRRIAIGLPAHPDAAEVHQQATWIVSQLAAEDESRLDEYRELLEESVSRWPTAEVSNTSRIWLGRIYEFEGQYGPAVDLYMDVDRNSPVAEEAVIAASAAADRELALLDGDPQVRDAVVSRLIDRLESWVPSTDSDPQVWNAASVRGALASVRIRLIHRADDASVASELAERVMNLGPDALGSITQSARAVHLVAVTATGDAAAVQTVIDGIGSLPPDEWLRTIETLWRITQSSEPNRRKMIAAATLIIVQHMMAGNLITGDEMTSRIARLKASFLRDADRVDEAITATRELLADNPTSGALLEDLANLLSASERDEDRTESLGRWRQLAQGSQPQSDRWFRAKYQVALALVELEQPEDARRMLRFMKENPPGWADSVLKDDFEALLSRVGG